MESGFLKINWKTNMEDASKIEAQTTKKLKSK